MEFADSMLFPDPFRILRTIADPTFLTGFIFMLVQIAVTCLLGGMIGVALGMVSVRSTWWSQAARRFLQTGRWVPFLIFWPLPIWPPSKGHWLETFLWPWLFGIAAVALSACYYYLSARAALRVESHQVRLHVIRETILQALFISLISQVWMGGYGWTWFFFPGPYGAAVGYAAVFPLTTLLFLVNLMCGSDFRRTAELKAAVILGEAGNRTWRSLCGATLLTAICLMVWQLVSVFDSFTVSSPKEVFDTAFRLLVFGSAIQGITGTLWIHIGVSIFEVLIGLTLGGATALLVSKSLSSKAPNRNFLLPALPLTYVVPLVLPFSLLYQLGISRSLTTSLGVGLLTFFPFAQAMCGLHKEPLFGRMIVGIREALPFAFIGMIFGEAMSAVAGLGFFMAVARVMLNTAEGLAGGLVTTCLLVLLSSTLTWAMTRLHLSEA